MSHPTFGRPTHKLETVTLKLWLPQRKNDFKATLLATGEATSSRSALWSHREDWPDPLEVVGMTLTDAVAHVALIAVQDQPASQDMFNFFLRGGKQFEEQQQLF